MAEKNIIMCRLNDDDVYEKLYPQTSATQSWLSEKTANLFSDNPVNADAALNQIFQNLSGLKNVLVRVIDVDGNPVQGVILRNISGEPVTNANGEAGGVWLTDPITAVSPYVDMTNISVNAASYAGTTNTLIITMPSVAENFISRYTSVSTVRFSNRVKNIDVCCVGGGGGGSGGYGHRAHGSPYNGWVAASWKGKGGAGGNIVNSYGISVTADTNYAISVGAGGVGSNTLIYDASDYGEQKANPGGQGGSTTFLSVTATGGGGATSTGGVGTSTNGGNGGSGNATGTEFDDGVTFYSGGGANGGYPVYAQGRPTIISGPVGGSPNGGYGGYTNTSGSSDSYYGVAGGNGLGAGGGGGGGNANTTGDSNSVFNYMTKGGNGASGLVAIRIHLK